MATLTEIEMSGDGIYRQGEGMPPRSASRNQLATKEKLQSDLMSTTKQYELSETDTNDIKDWNSIGNTSSEYVSAVTHEGKEMQGDKVLEISNDIKRELVAEGDINIQSSYKDKLNLETHSIRLDSFHPTIVTSNTADLTVYSEETNSADTDTEKFSCKWSPDGKKVVSEDAGIETVIKKSESGIGALVPNEPIVKNCSIDKNSELFNSPKDQNPDFFTSNEQHDNEETLLSEQRRSGSFADQSITESETSSSHMSDGNACRENDPFNSPLTSFSDEKHVDENNEMTLDETDFTSHGEDEDKHIQGFSVALDNTSFLNVTLTKAEGNNVSTAEWSEKTPPNCSVSTYLTGPSVESSKSNFQTLQYPRVYDFSTVLAKLDATISSENQQQFHPFKEPICSVSCTETFKYSIEEDELHRQTSNIVKTENCVKEHAPLQLNAVSEKDSSSLSPDELRNDTLLYSETAAKDDHCPLNGERDNSWREADPETPVIHHLRSHNQNVIQDIEEANIETLTAQNIVKDIEETNMEKLTAPDLYRPQSHAVKDVDETTMETPIEPDLCPPQSNVVQSVEETNMETPTEPDLCLPQSNTVKDVEDTNMETPTTSDLCTPQSDIVNGMEEAHVITPDLFPSYGDNVQVREDTNVESPEILDLCSSRIDTVSGIERTNAEMIGMVDPYPSYGDNADCRNKAGESAQLQTSLHPTHKGVANVKETTNEKAPAKPCPDTSLGNTVSIEDTKQGKLENFDLYHNGDTANFGEITNEDAIVKVDFHPPTLLNKEPFVKSDLFLSNVDTGDVIDEKTEETPVKLECYLSNEGIFNGLEESKKEAPTTELDLYPLHDNTTNSRETNGNFQEKQDSHPPGHSYNGRGEINGVTQAEFLPHGDSAVDKVEKIKEASVKPDAHLSRGDILRGETEINEDIPAKPYVHLPQTSTVDFMEKALVVSESVESEILSLSADASNPPSAPSVGRQSIEIKIKSLLHKDEKDHQCQEVKTSTSLPPVKVKFLNSQAKGRPIFAFVGGRSDDVGPFEVEVWDGKAKNVPIVSAINTKSCQMLSSSDRDHGALKSGQVTKQRGSECIVNQEEPVPKSPILDRVVSRRDSFTSSMTSFNSIDSKKSALKNSLKTASDGTSRPKQRVTFQIDGKEAERSIHLNEQTSSKSALIRCNEQQEASYKDQTLQVTNDGNSAQKFSFSTEENNTSFRESNDSDHSTEDDDVGETEEEGSNDADDDNDDGEGDDDLDPHHVDNAGLLKQPEETSLEIDTMDFFNLSNVSDVNAIDVESKQSAVSGGRSRTENEETLTEGICRSTLSDVEETSLHIISSVESLPRDEDAVADSAGPECVLVAGINTPNHRESEDYILHTAKLQGDEPAEGQLARVSCREKLDNKVDVNNAMTGMKKFIQKGDAGYHVVLDCYAKQEQNEMHERIARNKGTCSSIPEKTANHVKPVLDTKNANMTEINNDKFSAQRKWGRTEQELRAYVEEFQNLSSFHSSSESSKTVPRESLNADPSYANEKNPSPNKYKNTISEHKHVPEMSITDGNHSVHDAFKDHSSPSKVDDEAKGPSRAYSNEEQEDKDDTTIVESTTSIWGNSEGIQVIAADNSVLVLPQQAGTVPGDHYSSSNEISKETSALEIWIVPGSTQTDSNSDMPSQVIIMQGSSETSHGSVLESSSQENTSKLDFSTSLSQISQFDVSKLDKSIFSVPSDEAKRLKDKNKSLASNGSFPGVSDAHSDKKSCISASETFRKTNSASNLTDSNTTEPHATRVKFVLPSVSKQGHCRSRSLPRLRHTSRSTSRLMRRSTSVSPCRRQGVPSKSSKRNLNSSKRSVEIEASPERNGEQVEMSRGISSFMSQKSGTYTSHSGEAIIATNPQILSTSATDYFSIELTTHKRTEKVPQSDEIDCGIKFTGSSCNSQAEYEDNKAMATTIDSFNSHCEDYADPATQVEDQSFCLEIPTSFRQELPSDFNLSEVVENPLLKGRQQALCVEETETKYLDLSVTRSQSFPKSRSRYNISSNSGVSLGHNNMSIPRDDDTAWFAYRKEFGDFFMPSKSLGYSTEPPTEASDIESDNSANVSMADDLTTPISNRDYRAEKSLGKLSTQNQSLNPKAQKLPCVSSRSDMNLAHEDKSLPRDENDVWFAYRRSHKNLFTSAMSETDNGPRQALETCEESFAASSRSDKSKLEINSPKGFRQPLAAATSNSDQEMVHNSKESAAVLSKPLSPEQKCLDEKSTIQVDDTSYLNVDTGESLLKRTCQPELVSNSIYEKTTLDSAQDDEVYDSRIESSKHQYPDHASENLRVSNNPNPESKPKTASRKISMQIFKEDDAHWFRYRKKWSNLFSEEKANCERSPYKPYIMNNARYRLAMMKEDFDEPSKRANASKVSHSNVYKTESHHLKPESERHEIIEEPVGDASAMGDSLEKSAPDSKSDNGAQPEKPLNKCRKRKSPDVQASRESFVGLLLQESSPVSKVIGSQELTNVRDNDEILDHNAKPVPSRKKTSSPRERSLPRVRHTKRSLDTIPSVSAHENTSSPRFTSPDHGTCGNEGHVHSESPMSIFSQRLTRLPEIQPASTFATNSLASESRTSVSSNTGADIPQSSASLELPRSPNARRLKRLKREPLHLTKIEISSQQPFSGMGPTDKTRSIPPRFPVSDEAGEGDLLDEAAGGFEEGSLIDNDNLLFIKGVAVGEHRDVSGKQQSPRSQQPYSVGPDITNRIGGGDDTGPVIDAVGGLLQPPLEIETTAPATSVQVMTVQPKYENVGEFLRKNIPRKPTAALKAHTIFLNAQRVPTDTWETSIEPRISTVRAMASETHRRASSNSTVSSRSTSVPHEPDFVQQELLAAERAEQERQRKKRQVRLVQQRMSVQRLHSLFTVPETDLGPSNATFTSSLSSETRAGGDKIKKVRAEDTTKTTKKPVTIVKASSLSQSTQKLRLSTRKYCMMDGRGKLAKLIKGAAEPPESKKNKKLSRISSTSSSRTTAPSTKKGQTKVPARRVLAEGHYHHDSNVVSVVVKPVNVKLDREQLNLKVQVHRKPPENEALQPHPPKEAKPTSTALIRKFKLRRPSPAQLPVLASNIIDVRASNPPFNTTMSPEAHRRFQAFFGHRKVLKGLESRGIQGNTASVIVSISRSITR
ncbi:hypothetical protein ElyMa_001753100 [Elysia marginata]|uniref:Uncharacterized protein n=1 Tax=Elysia marginata TaxID=1093978 RepID=A0AAV4E9P3_9GAST|nr:hypothetical protein ElyMa_001753100 [Elysia marginata]